MGLIGRVVDPPVVSLVDVHQHQLAPHIQPVQLGGGTGARVDQGVVPGAFGVEVGLVAAQLGGVLVARFVFISKASVVEVPPVQRKAVLFHRKADGTHLGGQQLAGLELGPAAGGAVAQHRVGAGLFHPLCQHIGIGNIQIPADTVPLGQLLFDCFHAWFPLLRPQHRVGAGLFHPLCQHIGIGNIQIPADTVPLGQLLFDCFHAWFPLLRQAFRSAAQTHSF